jgi:spore cortex biosynthesis protein YabQ
MSLTVQFYTMLAMILMGSFFGAALDTYQRFLNRAHRKRWIVFVNDVLFWLVQGLLLFLILFQVNYGEVRFYIFLALLCGFAAYQALLRNFYVKLLEMIISMVISIYRGMVKAVNIFLIRPVIWIIHLLIAFSLLVIQLLWSLVKTTGTVLWWVLRIGISPFVKLSVHFWRLLPKRLTNNVEKLYNIFAGYFYYFTNYMYKRWTSMKQWFLNKKQ